MLDFVFEVLGLLVQTPSHWRKLNAGAVVFGAVVFASFGILLTAVGCSAFWGENSGSVFALKLLLLAVGLALLAQVSGGVASALRGNRERA